MSEIILSFCIGTLVVLVPLAINGRKPEREADFFEPVTFNWDEDIYIARKAAREYGERITVEL